MVDQQYRFGMDGSKWRIFESAVELFSTHTYFSVSMRDIAKAVGLKPASIYNHFPCKDDILTTIYAYYTHWVTASVLDGEEVERAIETEHPHALLLRLTAAEFPSDINQLVCKCFVVIITQLACDKRAKAVLRSSLFDPSETPMRNVLAALVEMEKIEPLDIDAFMLLYLGSCYYTTYSCARGVERVAVWRAAVEALIRNVAVVE